MKCENKNKIENKNGIIYGALTPSLSCENKCECENKNGIIYGEIAPSLSRENKNKIENKIDVFVCMWFVFYVCVSVF